VDQNGNGKIVGGGDVDLKEARVKSVISSLF
jgi:hypothetical protein